MSHLGLLTGHANKDTSVKVPLDKNSIMSGTGVVA